MIEKRVSAAATSCSRQREVNALEVRVLMLGNDSDPLKRQESTNCDLEAMTCQVSDAQGKTTNMVTGLLRDMVSSYVFIRHGVDGAFVEVSRLWKKHWIARRGLYNKVSVMPFGGQRKKLRVVYKCAGCDW